MAAHRTRRAALVQARGGSFPTAPETVSERPDILPKLSLLKLTIDRDLFPRRLA